MVYAYIRVSTDKQTVENQHLFEAMEMLKNNKDPVASENEKMDIETAKTLASLGKVVVEGYKVKANVLQSFAKTENPNTMKQVLSSMGVMPEDKLLE